MSALFDAATRALVVVAHPDDETIGLGGQLDALGRRGQGAIAFMHLTDGAPRDLRFAHEAGFATREAYAAARRAELDAALAIAGRADAPRRSLGLVDQEVIEHLPDALAALEEMIDAFAPDVIFTHPYEGGHPDHDAAALLVARAARGSIATAGASSREAPPSEPPLESVSADSLRALRSPPSIVEMAFYHRAGDAMRTGHFLDETAIDERRLDAGSLARKEQMLACFATQREVLRPFDPRVERFRRAPRYDFTRPPAAAPLLYETLGWPMTGARWRAIARRLSPPAR